MLTPSLKLVYMLWSVIAVLLIGFLVGGFLLLRHSGDIDEANTQLNGDNASLRRQLQEAKAAPTPVPTTPPASTPAAAANPTPTPSVVPTVAPKSTPQNKPKP